jgi:hypothetical protein
MWICVTVKGERMYQILFDLFKELTKEERLNYLKLLYDGGGSRLFPPQQAPFS